MLHLDLHGPSACSGEFLPVRQRLACDLEVELACGREVCPALDQHDLATVQGLQELGGACLNADEVPLPLSLDALPVALAGKLCFLGDAGRDAVLPAVDR
jgi:hypothetical protein